MDTTDNRMHRARIRRAEDTDTARVARALLDAASAFARDEGTAGMMLETTRGNGPARALCRAGGWNGDASQWYSLPLE